jgi:hypothetical protein
MFVSRILLGRLNFPPLFVLKSGGGKSLSSRIQSLNAFQTSRQNYGGNNIKPQGVLVVLYVSSELSILIRII